MLSELLNAFSDGFDHRRMPINFMEKVTMISTLCRCVTGLAMLCMVGASGHASEPTGLSPQESLEHFTVADGLDIELFASEPHVRQPLSLSFDDRGRMWVLQYIQYPIPNGLKAVKIDRYLRTQYDRVPKAPPHGPRGLDKVTILEDQNGDGRIDASKDFLSGLNLASGMALGDGGVYLVQPPYLLFYADRDANDVPDCDPEVLLTGFGMDDAHAYANSLTWGPDGWLYGAQGSTVTANIRDIEFQQGIWRFHPLTHEFELFAEGGGNTWGIDFDRFGNLFAGGNTVEPLCHHVQGAYSVKGFGKHGPLHNPYAFGYFAPVKHHGYVGDSLTGGFVLYQGGAFPDRFNGTCIAPNTRHSATRSSTLEKRGSTFATRAQGDFITSTDKWYRPVDSTVGPDGALYVADWYDYNISHSNPKDRSKWYVPSIEDGRIWRVAPTAASSKVDKLLPLGERTSDELIDLLDHSNAWNARTARRLLAERRDETVLPRLETMLFDGHDERATLQALWSLYVSGGFHDTLAARLLEHRHEYVRAWTIRLLGDQRQISKRLENRLLFVAVNDTSSVARSQLACSCKRLPGDVALPIFTALLQHGEDVDDPHIPLLLWWALEDKAVSHQESVFSLLEEEKLWRAPIVRTAILERLARRYTAESAGEGFAACAQLLKLSPTPADSALVIGGMEKQLAGRSLPSMPPELSQPLGRLLHRGDASPTLIRLALRLGSQQAYDVAIEQIRNAQADLADRLSYLQTLGEIDRPECVDELLKRLERDELDPIRIGALSALENYQAARIGESIVGLLPDMTGSVYDRSLELFTRRKSWSAQLLTSIDDKVIDEKTISFDLLRQIRLHDDPDLNERITNRWGNIRTSTPREKAGRIQAISQMLAAGKGDPHKGRALFTKHCATCHQLFGKGNKIGPDLTGAERKNRGILLSNVVDPNAVIRQQYRSYIAVTVDGLVLTGLLADRAPETVTVLDAKNKRTILRQDEIEELKAAEVSMMPEKILDPLTDDQLRDLFSYLQADKAPSKNESAAR